MVSDGGNGLKPADEFCLKKIPSPSSSDHPDNDDMPRFSPLPTIVTGPLSPPIHLAANQNPVLGGSGKESSRKDEKFDEEQSYSSSATNNRDSFRETGKGQAVVEPSGQSLWPRCGPLKQKYLLMVPDADGLKAEQEVGVPCSSKNLPASPSTGDPENHMPRFTPLLTIFTGALPPPVHPAISRKNLPSPNGCVDARTLQEGVARLDLCGHQPTTTNTADDAGGGAATNGASSLMHGEGTSWMVVQLAPVSPILHLPPPPLPQSATLPQQWRRSRFMPRDRNRVLLNGPEVDPLFEDEWCRHVNQRELQTKLREEREQCTRVYRNGSSVPHSLDVMPVPRRTSCGVMKMQRSGTRVWVERGSELASVVTAWNEEARKNALPSRGYANRDAKIASRGRGGYTLDNCHAALKKFVKRKVVAIIRQLVKRRNVSSTCPEVQVEWTIRVPALDDLNVRFESRAANLRKASLLCSLRIVTGLYEHGLVKEAELEFNRSRKEFLRPERDLPMRLRPYLECSSSFFEEILHNIEQRHGKK